MGVNSLQVCMDTSEWLQGVMNEEAQMDSSSSQSGDIITCSRTMVERRLRPQHDQALKCPRCDSTHTKFCYYNNYSLTQPRYFCKTCRRYWTKGGSLRNIPVGGGCRKNKKVSSVNKKSSDNNQIPNQHHATSSYAHDGTDLHLSFPELHLSHLTALMGHSSGNLGNPLLMENKYNPLLENPPRPTVEFMENKFDSTLGNLRNHDFMGSNHELALMSGFGDVDHHGFAPSNLHGLCSPYGNGVCLDGSNANVVDTCQRLMLPFEVSHEDPFNAVGTKTNKQFLSLEWQDQGCSEVGRDSFGYSNNLGSWSGVMNGYGSSTANPLV